MYDRYVSPDRAAIERAYHIGGGSNPSSFRGLFNDAPTLVPPVVRVHAGAAREIALLRCGLVPSWAKEPSIGARVNNVKNDGPELIEAM